jgi:hypothetical protein
MIEVEQVLGEIIRLPSANRPQVMGPGQVLPVELRWQAVASRPTDYMVFLQLLAPDGTLIAQHDGLPQGGYWPTGQWVIDEIVVDRRGLDLPADLPAGDYRLITGLYNPVNGQRLATSAGVDFVDLGIVEVTR